VTRNWLRDRSTTNTWSVRAENHRNMSKRNGHVNGFGLSDGDDSDPSSEEEEEEEELEGEGIVDDKDTHLNGHSTEDDEKADKDDGIEDEEDHDGDDQDDDDDNDNDDDSDSDSAPEDISFKSGRDAFQQQTQQQQEQIEKTLSAAKERRRRRDEQLKEQKAARLKKLEASKLSADFLQTLDSQAPPAAAVSDSGVDGADSGAGDAETAPEKEAKRRKLIPLPNVEGVEFEVVVQKSDADQQIMRKTNRYIKKHTQPKSVPRLSTKKKQSLKSKKAFLKRH